jgi:hypothetical protein
MEAYSAGPPDDPFAVSQSLFSALTAELAGPAAAALTASGLEELLDERGREMTRQLLQDHYDLRKMREEQQAREHPGPVEGADGITRTRLETGLHARTWVVLVDGAEHQLALIRAEAARRSATVHVIIDIIHVLEYIWGASWCLHAAGDPAAEDWVAARALTVLAGDSDRACREITAEADAAGLEGPQRNGVTACARYLENKREFLCYDQALEEGWPIATGVIEGACRHLIADRLSLSGSRWGLDGAEAVLTLRAVIANGDFEEYWRYRLDREHQRLYPGTAQRQYALGA